MCLTDVMIVSQCKKNYDDPYYRLNFFMQHVFFWEDLGVTLTWFYEIHTIYI